MSLHSSCDLPVSARTRKQLIERILQFDFGLLILYVNDFNHVWLYGVFYGIVSRSVKQILSEAWTMAEKG